MKNTLIALVVIFFIMVNLTGCQNPTNDTSETDNPLAYIDISNAKNIFISEEATSSLASLNARSVNTNNCAIYKITNNGSVEKVKYYYVYGNERKEMTVSQKPNMISAVNDNFIFIGFGNDSDISKAYLVRKSDGATFDMTTAGIPQKSSYSYKNSKIFKFDQNGNMYYLTSHKIVRVSLSNTENLESSTVSVSTDSVIDFNVDRNGNIIYRGVLKSDSSSPVYRIRKANGGVTNINATTRFWIGLDGNIYCWEDNYTTYYTDTDLIHTSRLLKKIAIDSNFNLTNEIYDYNGIADWGAPITNSYLVEMSTRIMYVSWNPSYASGSHAGIYTVYTETGTPCHENEFFSPSVYLKSVADCGTLGDYLYVAGIDSANNTMLFKYDYTTKNDETTRGKTQLLPLNAYDVYSFNISESDGITFNALRMSDGKKIIGKVSINGGNVTIIDEELDTQIEYLQQIN